MFHRLCDRITDFDLFATPVPGLNIQKRSRLFSWFGLLISVLAIMFLLSMLGLYSNRLARRKDPSFYSFEEPNVTINQKIYVFNPDTFQIAFALIDAISRVPYRDNTIYRIKPILHFESIVNGNKFSQQIILDVEPCTAAHFNGNFDGYANLWCVKPDSEIGKVFVTDWTGVWIEVQFGRCQAPEACAPDNVITNRLQQSEWVCYYPEYLINPLLYKTPLRQVYLETPRPFVLDQKKQVIMTIKVIDFESDNGLFFTNTETYDVLTLKGIDDRDAGTTGDGVFLTVSLVNSGVVLRYVRSYDKIPDILGNIFGLAEVIIPIVGLLVIPFAGVKTYEHVINNVFELRKKKPPPPPPKKDRRRKIFGIIPRRKNKKSAQKQISPKSTAHEIEMHPSSPKHDGLPVNAIALDIVNPNANTIEKEKESSSKASSELNKDNRQGQDIPEEVETIPTKIHVSYFKWLKSIFIADPEVEMYDRAKNVIEDHTDIITILKKALEIDKLKACLLTREQRILFDNLPRPTLYEDPRLRRHRRNSIKARNIISSYEGRRNELKDVYYYLKETENKSELDKKLLSLYEGKADYL